MKKLNLILATVLIISMLSACGKVDTYGEKYTAAMDDAAAVTPLAEPSAVPSAEPSEEPTPTPCAEPEPSPLPSFEPVVRNFPDDHWSKNIADAPAVPMDGMSAPDGMVPLKELPVDYSSEQAEADGCYGTDRRNHNQLFGTAVKNDFKAAISEGTPTMAREYNFKTSNQHKAAYPVITDIEFDGTDTITRQYIRDSEMQLEYELVTVQRDISALGDDVAADYDKDAERARKDGCIIIRAYANQPLYEGSVIWDEFIQRAEAGEKASVRFYVLYENTKFDTVSQLDYDGKHFIYTQKNPDRNALISTVYTNLSVYETKSWSALSETTIYMLNYSESYPLEYIEVCLKVYNDPNLEGNFYPPHTEVLRIISPEELTLDDFVLSYDKGHYDESGLSAQAHIYEIVPDTEEWNSLPDTLARRKATQVSKSEVENITAHALIKTIITYPFFTDVYAFNMLKGAWRLSAAEIPQSKSCFQGKTLTMNSLNSELNSMIK